MPPLVHHPLGSHPNHNAENVDRDTDIAISDLTIIPNQETPVDHLYTRKLQEQALVALNYKHDVERDIEKWDKIYMSLRTRLIVPGRRNNKAGKKCVEHISKFLEMFEGIAEIHFVAAIVVSSLKALMILFKDYFEIDTQILLVLVSATDVLRVLFDLRRLGISEDLRIKLLTQRDRIRDTTKSFGNIIDTFYKDRNFLKRLYKANDLTNKLQKIISEYDSYKDYLRMLLGIDTNIGVQSINGKLGSLVAAFEKLERMVSIETEFRKKASEHHIDLNDQESLLSLDREKKIILMNLLNRGVSGDRKELPGTTSKGKDFRDSTAVDHFDEMVKGIKVSFNESCKIQDSISYAKDEIVGEIKKGPYMRLKQKELREIWHEMGWVFCVKNKHFGMALIEYFVDRYSIQHSPCESRTAGSENIDNRGDISGVGAENDQNSMRTRNHPNAWTLYYLSTFVTDISSAIDVDDTGFIRISEANEFTEQIPNGWCLAEWCVYHGIGWRYEQRIYQERIYQLVEACIHQSMRVLPESRPYVAGILNSDQLSTLLYLSIGPRLPDIIIGDQLKSLVYRYAQKKDDVLRKKLKELNYYIDAENTLRLLGDEKDLETYILQLITLLLENLLQVLYSAEDAVLDLEDRDRVMTSFEVVADKVDSRLDSRCTIFKSIADSEKTISATDLSGRSSIEYDLDTKYGGLYRIYNGFNVTSNDSDSTDDYDEDDKNHNIIPNDILQEFPLPAKGPIAHNHDQTANDGLRDPYPPVYHWLIKCDFSMNEDHLHGKPCYTCYECKDLDLCPDCLHFPDEVLSINGHLVTHPLVKHYYDFPLLFRLFWIKKIAKIRLTQYRDDLLFDSAIIGFATTCRSCDTIIADTDVAFICLQQNCHGYYICKDCDAEMSAGVMDTDKPDPSPPIMDEEHHWWHTTLSVPLSTLNRPNAGEPDSDTDLDLEDSNDPKSEESDTVYNQAQIGDSGCSEPQRQGIEDKISELQAKTDIIEEAIKRMGSDLEEMKNRTEYINAVAAGLRTILSKLHFGASSWLCGTVVAWVLVRYIPPFYFALLFGTVYFLYHNVLR
ncbi:hypothetical protein BDQ17DRAFT_1433425 [Cyathus striatus]|nr:hypothetical protein BDQ17DRAFT_1433425 [Cyathus striatus]